MEFGVRLKESAQAGAEQAGRPVIPKQRQEEKEC